MTACNLKTEQIDQTKKTFLSAKTKGPKWAFTGAPTLVKNPRLRLILIVVPHEYRGDT